MTCSEKDKLEVHSALPKQPDQREAVMPPWAGTPVWPFTKNGILANTPSTSGVYVLGTGWTWVYIGESDDMPASAA
jgi:hypothetical protein